MEKFPPLGKYRHFKGYSYELIAIAKDSEEPERLLAVYRALYGDGQVWVRPLSMFLEIIERDGRRFPRFEYIDEKKP